MKLLSFNMDGAMDDYIRPEESAYSVKTNRIVTLLFALLSILCFLPVLLVFIVSFSSQQSVTEEVPDLIAVNACRYGKSLTAT